MNTEEQIPHELLEEIERFLNQQMPPVEKEAFLARVSANKELTKNLDEMQLIFLGIQEASLQERLVDFHKEIPHKLEQPKKKEGKLLPLKMWLVAASVVLIISICGWLIFFRQDKNEMLFTEYFQPDPGLVSAMSISENYYFDRAMVDYKTGNYEASIKTLDSLQRITPGNDTLNYFLGTAWLAKKQPGKAIDYLQKASALPNSVFIKDANWYLGLAHLKQGNKKEAIYFIQRSDHLQKEALLSGLK